MDTSPAQHRLVSFPSEFSLYDVNKWKEDLRLLTEAAATPVLVDLANVEMVYSAGLGALINGYKICNDRKIYYALVNVRETVRRLLKSTNLNRVLHIFSTLEEFEILGLDHELVGTRFPALDFTFEERTLKGLPLVACHGVMCEGPVFDTLLDKVRGAPAVVFDFSELTFIEAECLEAFGELCSRGQVFALGANEILRDEFQLFDLTDRMVSIRGPGDIPG